MVITFYEAMIDSQLHKINYKTLFARWGIALLVPLTPFFWGGESTLSRYPLRFTASAMYSMVL